MDGVHGDPGADSHCNKEDEKETICKNLFTLILLPSFLSAAPVIWCWVSVDGGREGEGGEEAVPLLLVSCCYKYICTVYDQFY